MEVSTDKILVCSLSVCVRDCLCLVWWRDLTHVLTAVRGRKAARCLDVLLHKTEFQQLQMLCHSLSLTPMPSNNEIYELSNITLD
jgi:hypothetical protein